MPLIVLCLLFVFSIPPSWAGLEAGTEAYRNGDYTNAFKALLPLAEQGSAEAQTTVAELYERGLGVLQDYAQARRWYHLAAEQGDSKAQFNLGELYEIGQGVPQNMVLAHMWYSLAAAGGDSEAARLRDTVGKLLTPAQMAEAKKLARDWKPKK